MYHDIDAFHRHHQAFFVAHVADKKPQLMNVGNELRHIRHNELLIFVAGKNDYLFYVGIFFQYRFYEFLAETSRSAGYKNYLVVEHKL